MGANAQTSVLDFTNGQVLTGPQMDISAGTGVPVFATTVTRDAAFGGANKVLAEGQTCYLESTNVVQYYDGAAWATVGPTAASGLVLIKAQTIGSAVSSVPVDNVFSSTYENYLVTLNGGVGSADAPLRMILGSTTAGYYWSVNALNWSSTFISAAGSNDASLYVGETSANASSMNVVIQSPQLAKISVFGGTLTAPRTNGYGGVISGFLDNTTQYTGFTITPAGGPTLTGGIIRVYGYQNS